MLVWDPSLEKYLAFGTLKTAALGKYHAGGLAENIDKAGDDTAPRPCCRPPLSRLIPLLVPLTDGGTVKIFDVLYLNDTHLTHKRLSERKRLLHSGKIFKDIEDYQGRLEFAEERRGKSGKDIRAMLERILETK